MRFSGSRPPEFLSLHVHSLPRYRKWDLSPSESGRAVRGHNPTILGALNSFMRLFLIIKALGRQKMRFSGSKPPEFLSLLVHSLPWYRKCVLTLPRSGRTIGGCSPPILGALNSFIRLFSIHQAMGRQKICFSRSKSTEFPFIRPPPPTHHTENGFFHLLSPVGQFGYAPLFWGRWIHLCGYLSSLKGLGRLKMRFSRCRPTEFPFIPTQPPFTAPKIGSLTF